jgi:hypothetical protein
LAERLSRLRQPWRSAATRDESPPTPKRLLAKARMHGTIVSASLRRVRTRHAPRSRLSTQMSAEAQKG